MIIGRYKELEEFKEAYASEYSEFVAVYGRRRVGKIFLVREAFDYNFTFQHAGLAKSNMKKQLAAWKLSMKDAGLKVKSVPQSWLEAFDLLKDLIRQSKDEKKVIFIDESLGWTLLVLASCLYWSISGMDGQAEGKMFC